MKHNLKVTSILIGLFIIAQLIGLYVINSYMGNDLPYEIQKPEFQEETSYLPISLIIIFTTIIALIMMYFRTVRLWKFWFFLSLSFCLMIAFAAFVNEYLALGLAVVFALIKIFKSNVYVHNFLEMFIYGGLAAFFVPVLSLFSIFILLIIISIYDIIAVWKTKHMIKLAKFQSKVGLFAGLFIPYGKNKAILGGGDIGFPLLFAGTVLKYNGLIPSLVIVGAVTIALSILLIFAKKDKFYPAMPFLSAGAFVGYGISLLI